MNLKHLIIPTLALLGLTACSNEEPIALENGKTIEVTFQASLPGGSRATVTDFGNGTTATKLFYAIYTEDGSKLVAKDVVGADFDAPLSTSVRVQLVTGNTYKAIFWAQAPRAPYTFTAGDTTADGVNVTADYTGVANNNESLDAFYVCETVTINDATQNVSLERPFAQLNIATSDKAVVEASNSWPTTSAVTLEVPNTLNLLNGAVSGNAEVTFTAAALPNISGAAQTIAVDGTTYDYLSLSYVFAPKTGDALISDVSMTVNGVGKPNKEYQNIPLRANYRTNILGNLLTTSTEFVVNINPIFNLPDNTVYVTVNSPAELTNALASLTPGSTTVVTATDDLDYNKNITVPANTTLYLDLGDNTLDQTAGALKAEGGSLTVENGKVISKDSYALYALKGGKVNVSNVELQQDATNYAVYATGSNGPTKIELTDVKIVQNNNTDNKGLSVAAINGATVDMSTVTIEHHGLNPAVMVQTANANMNDVNISSTANVNLVVASKNANVVVDNLTVAPGSIAKGVLLAQSGSKLTASNVTADISSSTGSNGVVVLGVDSSLDLDNINIKAGAYGLSTNATDHPGLTVVAKNSKFEAAVGVMYNIPGSFTATDCEFIGMEHGAFIRGGEATFTDCKITLNTDKYPDADAADTNDDLYLDGDWGTGNNSPRAALTYGNRQEEITNSYEYTTTVTLNGCQLSVIGTWADKFPVAYGYQTGDFLVKLIYDAATTFTGGRVDIVPNNTTVIVK